MLALSTAAAALLAGSASAAAAAAEKHPRTLKNEFLSAMNKHEAHHQRKVNRRKLKLDETAKLFEAELYGNSKKSAELRKKVIEKSTFVKPGERKLGNDGNSNGNYQQYQNEYNYYNGNNNNANDGGQQWKYSQEKDGVDDYFQNAGEWENAMGFDVTQFSLSYHRCAAVRQYDAEIAATEDTTDVFATKRFAVFRFCPTGTCMGWKEEADQNGYECDEDQFGEDYCGYIQEYAQYYESFNEFQNQMNCECEEGDEECECDQPREQVWGAKGDSCQTNFGEYLMEMDEYLQLMMEYQEDRFQTYCGFCEQCMFKVYEQWLKNGGNRKLSFEEFKDSEEHNQIRKLADSEEHRKLGGYYGACPAYDTCSEYANTCQHGVVDDYSQYFECTEVEKANGMVAYVAPHCAEDGETITLGVYSDQYCNNYIGNGVNIASFIGEEIDIEEDVLKPYYNSAAGATLEQLQFLDEENVCISCGTQDLMWTDMNDKNAYVDDDQQKNYDQESEINEICNNLYMVSARCDKHYRTYNSRSKQAKWAEAVAQEDLACDFIDSVMMGNYNEMGMIDEDKYNFRQQQAWMGNGMVAQEVGSAAAQVSGWQIFWLVFMILATVILAMWSMTLHKSLSKSGPWRPRRGFNSSRAAATPASEADVSRQNSGIVMGRSASNTSYYMT